ncbi:hypothetical protein FS837_009577 [Tulasnella sp. UAMH 9824]|nr:hypothetical protein FS837_009577 [Tulasnella sp. UAMH 9824]
MDPGPSKSALLKAEARPVTERWEVPFVYGFIVKFAPALRKKLGWNTPMDFEDALLATGRSPALTVALDHFLHNLWWKQAKPKCDCRPDAIERTLVTLFNHYCTLKEHSTMLWSKTEGKNVNPLSDGAGFYSLHWSTKLRILRQLVEWQLSHCDSVKSQIDFAWGVKHGAHLKGKQTEQQKATTKAAKESKAKGVPTAAEVEAVEAARLKEQLEIRPIGTDCDKKRYWAVDDSPRVWTSGNPWKNPCDMITVSSTRSELTSLEASIRSSQPATESGPKAKRGRFALAHDALLGKLEEHIPRVDEELARVERAARKQREKQAVEARFAELAAMRETRSARAGRKQVDYRAIENGNRQVDEDDDEEMLADEDDETGTVSSLSEYEDDVVTTRRSSRQSSRSVKTSRASSSAPSLTGQKRKSNPTSENSLEWRGERRSTRISGGRYQLDYEGDDEQVDHLSIPENAAVQRAVKKRRIMSDEPESKQIAPAAALPKQAIGSALVGTKRTEPRTAAVGMVAEGSTDGDTPSLVSDRKTPGLNWSDSSSLSSLSDSEEDF